MVQQIIITEPDILAGYLPDLSQMFELAERGKGTMTTLWIDRWNPEENQLLGLTFNVLDIARLIPSEHLVLYIPSTASKYTDIHALIGTVIKYAFPTSIRILTIIIADGYSRLDQSLRKYTCFPSRKSIQDVFLNLYTTSQDWEKLDIVIIPNADQITTNYPHDVSSSTIDYLKYMTWYARRSPATFTSVGLKKLLPQKVGRCEPEHLVVKKNWKLWRGEVKAKEIMEWREETRETYSWLDWPEGSS
jgi:hypothetical protein